MADGKCYNIGDKKTEDCIEEVCVAGGEFEITKFGKCFQ